MPNPLTHAVAERWLSTHRLGVYLNATGNDVEGALELYDWNAAVASACLRDVGHFEVLVRNRYAEQLTAKYPDWTSERSALWRLENGMQAARAKQAKANGKSRNSLGESARNAPTSSPGHIIANLTFGFWVALTLPERESTTWTPMVSRVLPGRARGALHGPMVQLNRFRNRLAHWEPVFSTTTGLSRRLQEFDSLFKAIDPDVADWVGNNSEVLRLLNNPPAASVSVTVPSYLGH